MPEDGGLTTPKGASSPAHSGQSGGAVVLQGTSREAACPGALAIQGVVVKHLLVKQAIVVPLAAMLVPILIALSIPGYSSIAQHISEAALLDHPIALIQRIAAIVAGLSVLMFGVGMLGTSSGPMPFTAMIAIITGVSLASNGVFVMGSPLHGLYGVGGFSLMLVPAFFAAEIRQAPGNQALRRVSLAVALLSVAYIWSMMVRVELPEYRGLVQRIFTVVYFGWYALAALGLLHRSETDVVSRSSSSARPAPVA